MNRFENESSMFLEYLKVRGYAQATLDGYGESLRVFFRFLARTGMEDLREATRETVRAYQAWLLGGAYARWTVRARLQALRRFFEHLEAAGAILLNPCQGLVLPRAENRLPRTVLTPAEARKVLDVPDPQTPRGLRDKAILELFYSTGIRREEMAGLNVEDLDLRHGFLRINQGKFARDRMAPVGTAACSCLARYLEKVRKPWIQDAPAENALWLTASTPRRRLGKQAIALLVKEAAQSAGLGKRVTPHVWRHTCATQMVARGANLVYVQQLLGHKSLETTERYTRVALPEIRRTFHRAHPRERLKPAAKEKRTETPAH